MASVCATNNYDDDNNNSIKYSAGDYGIQDCNDVFGNDEPVAIICTFNINGASFASSPTCSINSSASTDHQVQHYFWIPNETPSLKFFGLTNNFEQALVLAHENNPALQNLILSVSKKIHKTFLNKWTNEVLSKLVLPDIVSPDKVSTYINNGTLNYRLKADKQFRMNPTSM